MNRLSNAFFSPWVLVLAACLLGLGLGRPDLVEKSITLGVGLLALVLHVREMHGRVVDAEARQARFDRLVRQSPFGLIFIDERPDGVLVVSEANASAQMMLGDASLPVVKGRPVEEALPGMLGTVVPRRLADVSRNGGTAVFDGLPYEHGGVSGVYDVIAFPLAPGSIVLAVSDATSRMLLAETLRQRESELGMIVDTVMDALFIADAEGRILYANHAACGMCGYTVGELQDMALLGLVPQAERGRLEQVLGSSESEADADFTEWRMQRKDGSAFPAELAVRQLPDGRRLVSARDISGRKHDEERLRLASRVFTDAHEAIIITNTAGTIIDVNQAFCTLTGYPREELLGRNPRILQSGRQDAAFYRAMWRSLREAGHWTGEIWNRKRNGEVFVQANSISAVKDEQGEVTHYVGMSFDITQRREDEAALRRHRDHLQELVDAQVVDLLRAKNDAEQANSAKSEFLANMSHELRTPMHAILGFSDLGVNVVESNPAKAIEYFRAIHTSGERLLGLLNDLLDLSKLEARRTMLHTEPVALDELVRTVFAELASLALKRHVSLRLGVLADDPVVQGDRKQLSQVLHNLLSNALRFSPDGGVIEVAVEDARLTVDGHDSLESNALRLSVADRGPGIPATELEAIFEKFVQSSLTRDGAGGTGLGLSISREIVQLHGGRVVATNRLDGGALFEVLLPRSQVGSAVENAVSPTPTLA